MSVDLNWETLIGGPDGQALAETIKAFVHERFQQIALPNLIRSVKVHTFDFGSISPTIVLKDICEPLHDFYEDEDEDEDSESAEVSLGAQAEDRHSAHASYHLDRPTRRGDDLRRPSEFDFSNDATNTTLNRGAMLGGGPGLGYFHPAFATGFPGTSTPLAAVAGARFHNGPPAHEMDRQHSDLFRSVSPSSTATPSSRPTSRDQSFFDSHGASAVLDASASPAPRRKQAGLDRSPEDIQVVFHVDYCGNVRLSMTAEVVLDYPMPSFVAIPLKLTITGLTFNGVGIVAYIKKRAHLCFLSPDDAEALVGSEDASALSEDNASSKMPGQAHRFGGLLEEIKIESEMGKVDEGKQVLKNVGKIEKFILEQVQRIFEEEFVYPSFWTFLV